MPDIPGLLISLAAVLLLGFVFVSAAGLLVWALPIRQLADWLDRNDDHLTSAAVAVLALLVMLVIAGQGAIRL